MLRRKFENKPRTQIDIDGFKIVFGETLLSDGEMTYAGPLASFRGIIGELQRPISRLFTDKAFLLFICCNPGQNIALFHQMTWPPAPVAQDLTYLCGHGVIQSCIRWAYRIE